jgi:hypothetical protein
MYYFKVRGKVKQRKKIKAKKIGPLGAILRKN